MVGTGRIFKPDPALTGLYDDGYGAWKQALDAVLGLSG